MPFHKYYARYNCNHTYHTIELKAYYENHLHWDHYVIQNIPPVAYTTNILLKFSDMVETTNKSNMDNTNFELKIRADLFEILGVKHI